MKKPAAKKKDSAKKTVKSKKVEDLKVKKKVSGGATTKTDPRLGPFYATRG